MSDHAPEQPGRFVTKRATGPAAEVDCSPWRDTTGWTFGRFASKKVTSPAVDCSFASPLWLELLVSFDDTVAPATVFAQTLRLINTLHAQYRRQGLVLEYDAARSHTEGNRVVVALRLETEATEEQRMQAVARTRAELAKMSGMRLEGVEWAGKA